MDGTLKRISYKFNMNMKIILRVKVLLKELSKKPCKNQIMSLTISELGWTSPFILANEPAPNSARTSKILAHFLQSQ